MNSKKLGVGVVGTGMAAKPHALALNDLKDIIDIKGVYSRNAEKCQLFASKHQMPFVDNIEDLVQDLNLDTPLWGYFAQISDALTSYGGYSGAPPNEKITWTKLAVETPRFHIQSDASIVAPLIFSHVLGD